ncbi:MAG: TM1812 family CRISPR-associated protein [Lachnospiraceae bacterium]|nr:TM1812 family CRISPR-associated protein [Lachnospiraceae bacterium]
MFEIVKMEIGNSAVYKCIKTVCERMKEIARTDTKTNLYLDMQGARRYETFVINTVVKMLEVCDVKMAESVAVDFMPVNTRNGIANKIVDTTDNNVILEMVSGMNEFIKTGRGDTLTEFWFKYSRIPGIENDRGASEIITQIRNISNAISLCDVALFDSNLESLKKTVGKYEKLNDRGKQSLFQTFVADLREDYFGPEHDLLPKDERKKIINQIHWCIDKKLFQQALALIDEKIPENLVRSRILYYGNREKLKQLINGMLGKGLNCQNYLVKRLENQCRE